MRKLECVIFDKNNSYLSLYILYTRKRGVLCFILHLEFQYKISILMMIYGYESHLGRRDGDYFDWVTLGCYWYNYIPTYHKYANCNKTISIFVIGAARIYPWIFEQFCGMSLANLNELLESWLIRKNTSPHNNQHSTFIMMSGPIEHCITLVMIQIRCWFISRSWPYSFGQLHGYLKLPGMIRIKSTKPKEHK